MNQCQFCHSMNEQADYWFICWNCTAPQWIEGGIDEYCLANYCTYIEAEQDFDNFLQSTSEL